MKWTNSVHWPSTINSPFPSMSGEWDELATGIFQLQKSYRNPGQNVLICYRLAG